MGGMIGAFKKLKTRSGSFMAFVTVEDLYGSIECVCFPKVYDKIRNFLEADVVVSLSGKISIDDEKAPVIIVDSMKEFSLDETPVVGQTAIPVAPMQPAVVSQPIVEIPVQKPDKDKILWLNVSDLEDEDIEELMETLTYYEGECTVIFVKDGKKNRCSQKVTPGRALMAELAGFLPEEKIKLI